MNFLIFFLLLHAFDQRCLIIEFQLKFLKFTSQLYELGVSVDMGFVSLFIPINPDFPSVLFGCYLLLKL